MLICVAGCNDCSGSNNNPVPYIKTMPGIEFCSLACSKITKLYEKGDKSCWAYISPVIVDDKEMSCTEFCEYEMKNSVQLHPQCIYEKINTCSEIPLKCGE